MNRSAIRSVKGNTVELPAAMMSPLTSSGFTSGNIGPVPGRRSGAVVAGGEVGRDGSIGDALQAARNKSKNIKARSRVGSAGRSAHFAACWYKLSFVCTFDRIVPMSLHRLILPLVLAALACRLSLGGDPVPTPVPSRPGTEQPTKTMVPPPPQPSPTPTPTPEPTPTSLPAQVAQIPDPSQYEWSLVVDGFQRPLALEDPGDGRLFVVEQRGVIWIIEDGTVRPEPFLDIRDRVNDAAFEQGLLGLAFDPEFTRTGHFYVNYTRAGGDTAVSRFTAPVDRGLTDPDSETTFLQIDQPFSNHNGGDLEFGPDGFLYIATGDGGSGGDPLGNGQSLDTHLGKVLRIAVSGADTYSIPPDNPFAEGGGLPEIWAYGLRNPWRISFDSLTGSLYIGDVGQDAWEEIDFWPGGAPGGANFGWNHREGAHAFDSQVTEGLIDPVAEYPRSAPSCSVTGGEVVRAPDLPEWAGVYLYGDYCSGQVRGLIRDPEGQWQNGVLFDTSFAISSFGTGADGSFYLVDHDGAIYRLQPQ